MKPLLLLWALILASTYANASQPAPLSWAGCGITKKAFMAELASAFEAQKGIKIILEGGGAAKGIRRVADKSVAIGGTCRPKITTQANELNARLNPVAWDALTVIVHPDNPINNITLEQLRGVYEGRINNWKQLSGADQAIDLLVRQGKYSGVGRTLRELVFKDYDKNFVSDLTYQSSGPLEKAVENNLNAIAVTGISSAKKRQVKLLSLNDRSPDYENIRSGEYLLYRPLYITANPSHPRYREVKKFIDFAHSKAGREIIRKNGSVPYLDALNLIRHQRKQWEQARNLDASNS